MAHLHHLNGQIVRILNAKRQPFYFLSLTSTQKKASKTCLYKREKNSLTTEIKILRHLKSIPVDNLIHREFPLSTFFTFSSGHVELRNA